MKATKLTRFIMINFSDIELTLSLHEKCVLHIPESNILVYSYCEHNDLIKIKDVQRKFIKTVFWQQELSPKTSTIQKNLLWSRHIKSNFIFIYRLINSIIYSLPYTFLCSIVLSYNPSNKENILLIHRTYTNVRQNVLVILYVWRILSEPLLQWNYSTIQKFPWWISFLKWFASLIKYQCNYHCFVRTWSDVYLFDCKTKCNFWNFVLCCLLHFVFFFSSKYPKSTYVHIY